MWDLSTWVCMVAVLVPAAEPDLEEIVVEGTIGIGTCGFMPPFPVCVVRAYSDGTEYALVDTNGDSSLDLTDFVSCVHAYLTSCRGRVRVHGYLGQLGCGGFEGYVVDAIRMPVIVPLDDGPPCGDVTGNRVVDLSDPIAILNYLFSANGPRLCRGVSDVNGDENLDISDAIYLLSYLFLGGPGLRCA